MQHKIMCKAGIEAQYGLYKNPTLLLIFTRELIYYIKYIGNI